MKHVIRGAVLALITAVAFISAGCSPVKRTERSAIQEQEASTAAVSEYRDALEGAQAGSATTKSMDRKEHRTIHAVTAEGIAEEQATLDVLMESLRELPDGAGYAAKEGRAGVEIRKNGDRIEVTGRCDSINRLYIYYRDMSLEQSREIDSLQWEVARLERINARHEAELATAHEVQSLESEKAPGGSRWPWALAGAIAGAAVAVPAVRLKDKIVNKIKQN